MTIYPVGSHGKRTLGYLLVGIRTLYICIPTVKLFVRPHIVARFPLTVCLCIGGFTRHTLCYIEAAETELHTSEDKTLLCIFVSLPR